MKKTLDNIDLTNKIIVARFDLNVPLNNEKIITDNTRILKIIPTIKEIIKKAKNLIILTHLGRIKKEVDKEKFSVFPIYKELQKLLKKDNIEVKFENSISFTTIKKRINSLKFKEILLLENTRYYDVINNKKENLESKCSDKLAKFYASLGSIFVNDAFGTAHRKHASNYGISLYLPSVVGRLVEEELLAMEKILHSPIRPFVAILGGAKVSDKIGILSTFLDKADKIIIGGGMAYTFMVAKGIKVGKSLLEIDKVTLAKKILDKYQDKLFIPIDNIGTFEFSNETLISYFNKSIPDNMMGLDIGIKSIKLFKKILKSAKTILWNGPMGVFEFSNYAKGTMEIAKMIGKLDAYSVIGGGDSVAAIKQLDLKEYKFNHISTGGGALLTLLEGKELVGFSKIKEKDEK